MIATITRKIEFDAGHRIPDHKSKCRHLHGHRYVLEATVSGNVQGMRHESDDGMVLDFADLKSIMQEYVGDVWDHHFLCFMDDPLRKVISDHLLDGLFSMNGVYYLDAVPTAENLAGEAFRLISWEIINRVKKGELNESVKLCNVRLYETPNCWADVFYDVSL